MENNESLGNDLEWAKCALHALPLYLQEIKPRQKRIEREKEKNWGREAWIEGRGESFLLLCSSTTQLFKLALSMPRWEGALTQPVLSIHLLLKTKRRIYRGSRCEGNLVKERTIKYHSVITAFFVVHPLHSWPKRAFFICTWFEACTWLSQDKLFIS